MAKYERHLTGNFDSLLKALEDGILGRNISASFQEGSDYSEQGIRCAVRVYERFSFIGGNRLAANITLIGNGDRLFLSLISSGGSQAIFFKINTWGEEAFTSEIAQIVEAWERR